ncbi:MAG: bifunctional methylenetetrahydrofolate dehydrogenase/methenyltetrahydrofolate cyclohydrolase FolD [Bacteroidota bacterium]
MSARIIDGARIAETIRDEIKEEAEKLSSVHGVTPGLAVILVGSNLASIVYVRNKEKAARDVGFYSITDTFPDSISEEELLLRIHALNNDARIHGILVQLPLPSHISERRVIEAIDPKKDVDGFHPVNIGRLVLGEEGFKPCTPAGIQELLMRSGNDPAGKHVVIVGRSNIVGKPLANMLMQKQRGANAVVTVCHTGARDIAQLTRMADILVAAMGRARAITADMVKPGAVVIDVGINRIEDPTTKSGYRLVGDIDFDAVKEVASAITPVPGGVGPMTIAMLLKNTLEAARKSIQHK